MGNKYFKKAKQFSLAAYFRELFRDERRRKSFLVGVVVFIIVFVGTTLYQHNAEKARGDVIITDRGNGVLQEGAEESESGFSGDTEAEGPEGNAGGEASEAPGGAGASGESGASAAAEAPQIAIFVDVGGAVKLSGLFALPAGSRVADAIEAAGGLTDDADLKTLNRAAILSDGDRLYVPTTAEVLAGTAPPTAGQVTAFGGYSGTAAQDSSQSGTGGAGGDVQGGADSARNTLVNINTSGSEELQKLNGVGPVTAQKIIDYRLKSGGFKRIEELVNVSGIGAKTFEKLKPYITV